MSTKVDYELFFLARNVLQIFSMGPQKKKVVGPSSSLNIV